MEKVFREKVDARDGSSSTEIIRSYLEKNAKELGLPLLQAEVAAVLLYDGVFDDVITKEKDGDELDKEKLAKLVKDILQKFAEQLEANPVQQDLSYVEDELS